MHKFRNVLLAGTILFGSVSQSFAYYSKTNYAEYFEIPPNASAFLIPLQGANVTNQAEFGSEAYLKSNKVAAKRVEVPHTTLPNTGTVSNYNVPSAKLFLVDRTPFNREWTDSEVTGTSKRPEGFHFESKDSLNIETDITIAASVSEADAAKFFYNFGTRPDTTNPVAYDPTAQYQSDAYYSASFSSIGYGRSLADVMDTVGRGKVQQELSEAFGSENLSDAIQHKAEIIKKVRDDVTTYFALRGITIEYIGYDNSLNYDKEVQDSINNVYVQQKNAEAIQTQASVMPIRQQIANVGVTENFGKALLKSWPTIPSLPSFMILPSTFPDWITNWFGGSKTSDHKS